MWNNGCQFVKYCSPVTCHFLTYQTITLGVKVKYEVLDDEWGSGCLLDAVKLERDLIWERAYFLARFVNHLGPDRAIPIPGRSKAQAQTRTRTRLGQISARPVCYK
jgi:hypothetical protein